MRVCVLLCIAFGFWAASDARAQPCDLTDLVLLEGSGSDFEVVGEHLYIAGPKQGVQVHLAGSREAYSLIRALDTGGIEPVAITSINGAWLVAASLGELAIWSLDDPADPALVGVVPIGFEDDVSDVLHDAGVLYVGQDRRITAFDASEICAPELDAGVITPLSVITLPGTQSGFPTAFDVNQSRLAVGERNRITLYDTADPAQPILLGEASVDAAPNGVHLRTSSTGGIVVLAAVGSASSEPVGVVSYTLEPPGTLVPVSHIRTTGDDALYRVGQDRLVRIGRYQSGLSVIDIADPLAPRELWRSIQPGAGIRFAEGEDEILSLHPSRGVRALPNEVIVDQSLASAPLSEGLSPSAMHWHNSTMYLADLDGLVWGDVTDPSNFANPQFLPVQGGLRGMQADGAMLVARGPHDVWLFQIAPDGVPGLLARIESPGASSPGDGGEISAMHLAGEQLFVAHDGLGIFRYNIAQSTQPVLVGFYQSSLSDSPQSMVLIEETLYVLRDARIIRALDAPAGGGLTFQRSLTSDLYELVQIKGLARSGSRLIVCESARTRAFDVQGQGPPDLVGMLEHPAFSRFVWNPGDTLLGLPTGAGVVVIDMADPSEMRVIQFAPNRTSGAPTEIAGGRIWETGYETGLDSVRFEPASLAPLLTRTPGDQSTFQSLATDGQFAYIAGAGVSALRTTDLSIVSWAALSFTPARIAMVDQTLFVTGDGKLQAVDASDPGALRPLGEPIQVPGSFEFIAFANTAVIFDRDGLHLIDVLDPSNPVMLAFEPLESTVIDAVAIGTTVYAATEDGVMEIIDCADPSNPIWRQTFDPGLGRPRGIASLVRVGDRLHAGIGRRSGIWILDVSRPFVPELIGTYLEMENSPIEYLSAGYGAIAVGEGPTLFDAADPDQPIFLGTPDMPPSVGALWIIGDRIVQVTGVGVRLFSRDACWGPWCAADRVEPLGVLNFFDVVAYFEAFTNADPSADLAEPFGVINFFDAAAYIDAFTQGCPEVSP